MAVVGDKREIMRIYEFMSALMWETIMGNKLNYF